MFHVKQKGFIMYRLVIDTETIGNIKKTDEIFVYDCGIVVCSDKGKKFEIMEKYSIVVNDIFFNKAYDMQTAYYKDKLPQYYLGIANKKHAVMNMLEIKKLVKTLCKEYGIKTVWAFNAAFDRNALNNTCKILSNGFCEYFLPYGVKWADIAPCACEILCNSKNYFTFAINHNGITDKGNLKTNAEIIGGYLMGEQIQEEHTGLSDALLEAQILHACLRRHKKMNSKPRPAWQIPQKKFKEWL